MGFNSLHSIIGIGLPDNYLSPEPQAEPQAEALSEVPQAEALSPEPHAEPQAEAVLLSFQDAMLESAIVVLLS